MRCVIQQQAMGTHGRVYPSGVMFALVMGRTASGPIHAPLAESGNVTKTKERRFSIMNEDWIVSEKRRRGWTRSSPDITAGKSNGLYSLQVAKLLVGVVKRVNHKASSLRPS